jgi:ABC-2 type transport system ATP-binding protein
MICLKDVVKRYGNVTALNQLSLQIKEGTIFGLLGVNGAGKSTVLSILNGLTDFDEGHIEVFGLDLKKEKNRIKEISSFIPQNLAFYEKLTVKENLDFFGKIQKCSKENYEKAIEINSLSNILNQTASTLSGGQKRRLNIAIGLLNNPRIIYFDEPTVGVDPKNRNEILDSIKHYKEMGITVVYTSHYMNEIERICDEVAIIDQGKVVKQDRLENLLSNRTSDKVLIEVVYNQKIKDLKLNLKDETLIETNQEELTNILEILHKNEIFIKQIRFGATNLEKYFLEVTGHSNV